MRRAEEKGAAAVFEVNMLPGNIGIRPIPCARWPAFVVGHDDGVAATDDRGWSTGAGEGKLSVERVPNLKTALNLGHAARRH